MADGGYQRTCDGASTPGLSPPTSRKNGPTCGRAASQYLSTIGGKFDDQVALRTHYQQLAAAARCPQCGATSFTQQKVAESPTSPESPSEVPPSAPPASAVPDGQIQTYVLNQKLISLTGDSWIEDGQGNHAFEVDGQLLSLRGTHVLKDLSGQPLYEISKPLAPHLHKTIDITHAGQTAATVQEAVFHLGGDKFKITLGGAQELTVKGDWQNRELSVTDEAGRQIMTVSRAWFSIHDGYGINRARLRCAPRSGDPCRPRARRSPGAGRAVTASEPAGRHRPVLSGPAAGPAECEARSDGPHLTDDRPRDLRRRHSKRGRRRRRGARSRSPDRRGRPLGCRHLRRRRLAWRGRAGSALLSPRGDGGAPSVASASARPPMAVAAASSAAPAAADRTAAAAISALAAPSASEVAYSSRPAPTSLRPRAASSPATCSAP